MVHVLIAGAGIGGLTAALTLERAGARVTVYERAARLEETGAGVQLSPNATRILARLGLLEALAERAFQPEGIRVRSARRAGLLVFMPLHDAVQRWGSPYLVVHRADLQAVLQNAVSKARSITLTLDTTLTGFGATAGGVQASVKQTGIIRTIAGDALVGADGIRSTVRAKLVEGEDQPNEVGRTAWRALVPADIVDPMFRARETGLWLDRDAHLVHYPVDSGRQINVVAIIRERTGDAKADLWAAPGDPSLIRARFEGWHRAARGLVAAAPAWTTWPLFDRAPLAAWNAGPIALLGDAAHPILPFLAQGSAQAIEDAEAIAAAFATTRDLVAAFASYSNTRRPRAARVQDTSRALGRIYHLGGPAAVARNLGMRVLGGRGLLARYDWLYGPSTPANVTSRATTA